MIICTLFRDDQTTTTVKQIFYIIQYIWRPLWPRVLTIEFRESAIPSLILVHGRYLYRVWVLLWNARRELSVKAVFTIEINKKILIYLNSQRKVQFIKKMCHNALRFLTFIHIFRRNMLRHTFLWSTALSYTYDIICGSVQESRPVWKILWAFHFWNVWFCKLTM